MTFAADLHTPAYYEGLAAELETVAERVRNDPALNNHLAERLAELAKELRDDTRRIFSKRNAF